MRQLSISARLMFALSVSGTAVLAAAGFWQLSAEEADLRKAAERELQLLGRSLQVAFENALRDRQSEDVEETLRELERIDPSVDIFLFDAGGRQIAASTGALPLPTPTPGEPTGVRFTESGRRATAALRLPLELPTGAPRATLMVVQPLHGMYSDLAATRRRVILSTVGIVALVVLLVAAMIHVWVKSPLRRMVQHIRRVREGDLSTSEQPNRRRDEIGATLAEFDALVRDLAEARHQLETEGEARRQLELALREADKLATVGQLAAGLAHEIGSPLQILAGRIAGLEDKADDPGETRRLARILREQTQRITRIVARLSDLARRRAAPARRMAAGPPIRTVVDLLRGEARRRHVSLTLAIDDGVPDIEGDPDSIQQLALNLLRNALDATPREGAIGVRVDTTEEGEVRLQFTDTGHGMNREERRRAFEPFFTTRSGEGGSGLGLALVKGIVDELGGEIELRSAAGKGTTVTVYLPGCTTEEVADGTH